MTNQTTTNASDMDPQAVAWLAELVRRRLGIDLSGKDALVKQRLQSLLWKRGIGSLEELCVMVEAEATNPDLVLELFDRITTHHTAFFRDAQQFRLLASESNLEGNRSPYRIWSAACSTGEEPYTIAMMLAEEMGLERFSKTVSILGTDISQLAIHRAEQGIYQDHLLEQIPAQYRTRYTVLRKDGTFGIIDALKQRCLFRRLNLQVGTYPLSGQLDWIVCRNVLIYFPESTRNDLFRKFAAVSGSDTKLLLGLTEAIGATDSFWVKVAGHVYRRRDQYGQ